MHFASNTLVSESVEVPFKYMGDNVVNGLSLLRAAVDHGVRRFVLSSTANLFDRPQRVPIGLDRTKGMRYAALRYFNAAGASERFGEHHEPETHLIPLVLQVAMGRRERLEIFGDDYPTPDGTCVRDYVHVVDLAQAHILALKALDSGSRTYNLGNGRGFSVRQVIETAREITGHPIPAVTGPRRPGDPAVLVASSRRISEELGWKPRYPELRDIIQTAWDWHRRHPQGYAR